MQKLYFCKLLNFFKGNMFILCNIFKGSIRHIIFLGAFPIEFPVSVSIVDSYADAK